MTCVSKILIAFLFSSALSYAEIGYNFRTKLGFDLRALKTNPHSDIGWMGSLRAARFFGTSKVFMGLAASFGAPTGRSNSEEFLYYGGIHFGVDGRLSRKLTYELSLISGYGEGKFTSREPVVTQTSHFVFEPSFSIGVPLGGGWRLSFASSYIHMPEAPTFSGPTLGFRFEHRTASAIREIND